MEEALRGEDSQPDGGGGRQLAHAGARWGQGAVRCARSPHPDAGKVCRDRLLGHVDALCVPKADSPLRRPRSQEPFAGPARATRPTLRPARAANGKAANGATSLPRATGGDSGSPSHGAANWLGDMAGCLFALALCGTLLPIIDALELEFVTSSFERTNRKGSREEAGLPPRLCFSRRVSGRARAEGAGELASRVARMSSEAPPLRLYIKRWRGARRRHFALEWSSL